MGTVASRPREEIEAEGIDATLQNALLKVTGEKAPGFKPRLERGTELSALGELVGWWIRSSGRSSCCSGPSLWRSPTSHEGSMTEWPLVPPWLQLTTSMGGLRPTRDDALREAPEEAQGELIDGSFRTMMARTARFHRKHDFDDPISNGHDMGYRLALTMEELGEFCGRHHQRETRNGRRGGTRGCSHPVAGSCPCSAHRPRAGVPRQDGYRSHATPSQAWRSRHPSHRVRFR